MENTYGKSTKKPAYTPPQRRVLGAMELKKDSRTTYKIIGFDEDNVAEAIATILSKKDVEKAFGEYSIKSVYGDDLEPFSFFKTDFFYIKGERIEVENIQLFGETAEYTPDIDRFCMPRKGRFFYDYNNEYYEYYFVGIEEAHLMWETIKKVLHNPKYAIIYGVK